MLKKYTAVHYNNKVYNSFLQFTIVSFIKYMLKLTPKFKVKLWMKLTPDYA